MEERKHWFKAKRYGYGWYPATWQGWLIILVYLLTLWLLYYNTASQHLSDTDSVITFVPQIFIVTILLVVIAWKKGEPTHWRWGK